MWTEIWGCYNPPSKFDIRNRLAGGWPCGNNTFVSHTLAATPHIFVASRTAQPYSTP